MASAKSRLEVLLGPEASRPQMPGYGLPPASDGAGLLPWKWASQRLESSHNYWLATTRPGGRPHVMPLWGIWIDESFVFSTGAVSVKAKNLRANQWCVLTTEDAAEAVIVEGAATLVDDSMALERISGTYAAKYGMPPPKASEGPLYRLTPTKAFGFIEGTGDFTATATRWVFPDTHSEAPHQYRHSPIPAPFVPPVGPHGE